VALDVGEPEPVRGGCAERAVHEVGRPLHERCRVGGPDRPGPGDSAEAERGHEPADPITTDRDALSDESAPELADAIDAEVGGMDPADLELLALPRFDGQLDYAA